MKLFQALSRFFWSVIKYPDDQIFQDMDRKVQLSLGLVRAFYVFNLYYAFTFFQSFHSTYAEEAIDLIWPSFLLRFLPFYEGKMLIAAIYLFSALFVVLDNRNGCFRFLAALGALFAFSLPASYGRIGHSDHLLLYALIGISFFPMKKGGKDLLMALFNLQGFLLFSYSLCGAWKFFVAVYQLFFDTRSAFHLYSMAEHVSYQMLSSGYSPPLSKVILAYPQYFAPLLLAGIYVEMFSLATLSNPKLHKLWGILLISLHISTYLSLQVGFVSPLIVLGLFIVNSPFYERCTLRETLMNLPLVRLVLRNKSV